MEAYECSSSCSTSAPQESNYNSSNSIISHIGDSADSTALKDGIGNANMIHNNSNNRRRTNNRRIPSHNNNTKMSPSTLLLTIATTLTAALLSAPLVSAEENNFNSYWNGEWQADGNANYECNDCDDAYYNSNRQRPSDMWVDDNVQQYKAEEYLIIRNVSLALLGLLTFSCCMCYPECLILTVQSIWNKMNCCCPDKRGDEDGDGGDYVGGKMDSSGRKMKKKRSKRVEEPAGLAANADVEIV